MPKPSKYHQHGAEYLSKINENHGCLADAFLERFGAAVGCQLLDFGSQNLQNISKTATQIHEKSRLRFWNFFGADLGRQGGVPPSIFGCHLATILDQKLKKGIQKGMQKSMLKKY